MLQKLRMFLVPLLSVIAVSSNVRIVSSQTTYSCPGLFDDPTIVPVEGSGSTFIRTINKSTSSSICVLIQVTPRSDAVDMNNITRDSKSADFHISPVARSYNNRDWERVAGPYAQKLEIQNCCTLVIPKLNNNNYNDNGKFLLMPFTNQLNDKEEVSRFFQQTTFGPTLDMINNWNYDGNNNNMQYEMADWVKNQMNNSIVPQTSHRAYFRRHLDFSFYKEDIIVDGGTSYNIRPRHPCKKYARWRRFSFTADDYEQVLSVSNWNGQLLLSINGVPRTVVSSFQDEEGLNIGVGTYGVCWGMEEVTGGWFGVYDPIGDDCMWTSNPTVNMPDGVITNVTRQVLLPNLSDTNFGSIEKILLQDYVEEYFGEAVYLKNDIATSGCSSIPADGSYGNILGTTAGGEQVWYASHLELDTNTVENPVSDSGAAMMKIVESQIGSIGDDFSSYACPVASKSFMNIHSCNLSTNMKACSSTYLKQNDGDAVIVCGSPNEDANDPLVQNTFTHLNSNRINMDFESQKKNVWSTIALESDDQLRQRMAWALSQIFVVSPNQIDEEGYSEIYLNYYDIFVRNAFGNYFDILKEVSYSSMMAEMLSFLESKSTAYVLEDSGANAYPDENYAREIMQLFSIGVYELNIDGTNKLDGSGSLVLTYDNTHIQNFARAWTGFIRQPRRSNIEMELWDWENRMDPMKIRGVYRDPFPKADLHGGFIGDKAPLCIDLPDQHFLKEGAVYRLLGSSLTPELHEFSSWWEEDDMPDNVLLLSASSNLKSVLSSKQVAITLDTALKCTGNECDVDTLRLVQIDQNPPIYYEYIRPPCVELSFYDNGKKISTRWSGDNQRKSMCANQKIDGAHDACCANLQWSTPVGSLLCYYDLERTTYTTAQSRCKNTYPDGDVCDHFWVSNDNQCTTGSYWMSDNWFWTNQDCAVKAKVNEDGHVAIVHEPTLMTSHPSYSYSIDLRVHPDNTNFFKVNWNSNDYPNESNSCGIGACVTIYRGCYCNVEITESSVFISLPSENQILDQLDIGALDPQTLEGYSEVPNTGVIKVWHKNGFYDKNTIFGVTYRGKETFLKNTLSTVQIIGATQFSFRNPPSFMNIAFREPRDAVYESEAVLENYFYHDNVAPFLALRLIQRFGISNPSPRYVESVATAFKDGIYSHPNPSTKDFGDGMYGNLESVIAAIILDSESRSVVVDADPTSGSLIEPILKVMRVMRAMSFQGREEVGKRLKLVDLQGKIGQGPYSIPNVFSFFRPEYAAPGHIKAASLSSPEAQVMSGPKVIGILNGIISLVNLGLTECYSGFGGITAWRCDQLEYLLDTNNMQYTRGKLLYVPTTTSDAGSIIDELSLLLTAGRLNSSSRDLIIDVYNSAPSKEEALKYAQNLIIATPEFHSTNLIYSNMEERPEIEVPEPSNDRYKAIVFVMLDGGLDSFNVLVPHSGCNGGSTSYEHYNATRGAISIPKNELHQIDASSSSQVCSTFGIHPNLPHLKSLYDDKDLIWMANMGVLQELVTKGNWQDKTDQTALFAHNVQYDEVHKMDIFDQQAGRGVGGRMIDVLLENGINAGTVSVSGLANALVSNLASLFVLDPRTGFEQLNPIPWARPITENIKDLNNATKLGSGLFSETWSNLLFQALGENKILYDSLTSVTLPTVFPRDSLGRQMELVSKLIKTKVGRANDRDIYYVESGGFDTHDNIKERLDELTDGMNKGIEAFTTEMKAQGSWDDVTVVVVSEFARTLAGNTGAGSDHAWGGNYFITGGEVDGKKIIGAYPDTLSDEGPLVFKPGVVIPTLSFDSLWNGVAEWFGITNENDLNEVLPNRNEFIDDLFHANDLYTNILPTQSPTTSVTSSPSSITTLPPSSTRTLPPSSTPTVSPSTGSSDCDDSPFRFKIVKNDGSKITRSCTWAANKSTNLRCGFVGVSEQCPSTCDSCSPCVDAISRFRFTYKGKSITRDCTWVKRKDTINRCKVGGMENTCRVTCRTC